MNDKPSVQVLAVCGSLRKGSLNRMAMNYAIAHAPREMRFCEGIIAGLPLYNEDVRLAGEPDAVTQLKRQVKEADALLFATPEYNYGMPGVLKNAIDWVSRPPDQSPFDGKPVAMMGASTGLFGTVRSQLQLRQTCLSLNMLPLAKPEVMILQAQNRFAEDGSLKDDATGKYIVQAIQALYDWTLRLKATP